MNATNTFQNGLVMDPNPLATSNDVLTNCLNGTLITYNGNELILQNDVGNSKIPCGKNFVKLSKGFIPIGLKEYGGILYIFSVNPNDTDKNGKCLSEIGTFPSPNYELYDLDNTKNSGQLLNIYLPLHNLDKKNFTTYQLDFDVNHPITIDCLKSYDGSINLIFTDNKNIPRIINTRFSLYGNGEYEIVDRSGLNDSNLYKDDDNFLFETSLNKIVNKIVKIEFEGIQTGGNLNVGNYTFYFTLADSDDNESDFIGLSGIVTCHKGNINDPMSIDGGIENENSYKQVKFKLSNIPKLFNRIYVYYSKSSSDTSGNALTTYHKINKYYDIPQSLDDVKSAFITISGFELTLDVSSTTINTNYLNLNQTKTQAVASDILFYGNITEQTKYYDLLKQHALNNISITTTSIELGNVNPDFTFESKTDSSGMDISGGYYNTNNIYHYVGYWPDEFYRFGIVYILKDYSLTPVFNMRGNIDNNEYGIFLFKNCEFDLSITKPIGIRFLVNNLPDNVIGYFFVRQKRLKTILALGVRIGTDLKFSYLPLLYTNTIDSYSNNSSSYDLDWIFYPNYINNDSLTETDENTGATSLITTYGNTYALIYQGTYANNNSNLYGNEALNKFWSVTKSAIIPLNPYYHYLTNESLNNSEVTNSIDLGWFTESFLMGEKEQRVANLNMRIYNTTNLWSKYARPYQLLGDSFLGTKLILRLYSTIIRNVPVSRNGIKPMYNFNPEPDAAIVPEYEINLAYFNSIFTGGKLLYKKIGQYKSNVFNEKVLTTTSFLKSDDSKFKDAYVIGVPENTPAVRAKDKIYSSVAGDPAEGNKTKVPFTDYRLVLDKYGNAEIDGIDCKSDTFNINWAVRGIWGPYVGIEEDDYSNVNCYDVINITIPNRSNISDKDLLKIRLDDSSEYYAISDRIDITDEKYLNITDCYRGDAFICNFAHTMNRNFLDPSFPTNTEIADIKCWAKSSGVKYDSQNKVKLYEDTSHSRTLLFDKRDLTINNDSLLFLNRSDVNAVPIGHVFVTKIYSSTNLCMRSTDGSNITERSLFNKVRSFYPLSKNGSVVSNKIPDSYVQNGAYEKSLGEQIYALQLDVPALKTNFSNRIVYSDIAVKDSYINNLRVFRKSSFLDYTRQYGEIIKIISYYDGYLFCVFEHAIALIEINERAIATNSDSGFAYIDSNKVLSDKPKFLSTEFGSLWPESIITTSTGIYGIDTIAKKIWYYGQSFEVISDLKIQSFLRDNLEVLEYDFNCLDITKLNVKSHYNKSKLDVMFTFYKVINDDFIGWNICYNEITGKWTTFYSWIPSYSGNINNTFYSFNVENAINIKPDDNFLWKHGKSNNNWCLWYDEQHPFEFEFIVADHPEVHKIFNNLKMIANKTLPESFHYEVVGESYDFKLDKLNMYYRLEKTKQIYDNNYTNVNISYDKNYKNITPNRNQKSAIFPLTISHVNKKNKIYDVYQRLTSTLLDYLNLSGSEIVYNRLTDDYDIATHIKAYPINSYEWTPFAYDGDVNVELLKQYYKSHNILIRYNRENECWEKKIEYGRRLGNCKYSEDIWEVLIPTINYAEKNESWDLEPPINIVMTPVPEDLMIKGEIDVPKDVELDYWKPLKQTRLRDKYIKIRVRYSGLNLAIISAIITQYKESYN